MDYQVTWSPEALIDVEAIAGYIARDSRHYASAVVSRIISDSRNLARFPLMNRVVPEVGDNNIRECFIIAID